MTKWIWFGAAALALLPANVQAHPANSHHASAGGSVLWHGIRVGMTQQQAIAAYPGLTKDPMKARLTGPVVQVAGDPFNVSVDLSTGRVSTVSLLAERSIPQDVAESLKAKYGAPDKPYSCTYGVMTRCGAEWRIPKGVKVSLIFNMVDTLHILEIRYAAPDTQGL